jgi:hypothetical protein
MGQQRHAHLFSEFNITSSIIDMRLSNYFFWLIAFALISGVLPGCGEKSEVVRVSSPSASPEAVFMTEDAKGNPVVVWLESDTVSAEHSLFYAISNDQGVSFPEKVRVPIPDVVSSHAEGMPKVAFMKNGGVIAGFEKSAPTPDNKYAGAVYYILSRDGKSWTAPRFLHSDTVSGRSRGFFDIHTLPDGTIGASWLDIKSDFKEKGRSIRFSKTDENGIFHDEIVIEPFACECCRTDLYVDAQGGINIAYRSVRKGNLDKLIRDMAWARSTDGGATFSQPVMISDDHWVMDKCPHTGPSLGSTTTGLHALWYSEGNGMGIFYAQHRDGNFTAREQISQTGKHPQLATRGEEIFMVFEETIADRPMVAWQLRSEQGIKSGLVTADSTSGFFPVTIPVSDGYCVAYMGKDNFGRSVFVKKYASNAF